MSGSLRAWRPMLRFARRDARRHLARTILASLLVAVPIAGLVGFVGFSNSDAPSSERALAAIPGGAPLYARVDLLPSAEGPQLLELELTEPSLFFGTAAGSVERFVAAIEAALTDAPGA